VQRRTTRHAVPAAVGVVVLLGRPGQAVLDLGGDERFLSHQHGLLLEAPVIPDDSILVP
jgi:hypothetical protein